MGTVTQEKLAPYTVRLKGGREYLTVAGRMLQFRGQHPGWGILTEAVQIDMERNYAIFRTTLVNDDGKVIATATGSETARDFADFIEKAETKSLGRALVLAGFGTDAAGYDLDEGERFADAPQQAAPPPQAPRITREPVQQQQPKPEQPAAELVRAMTAFGDAARAAGLSVDNAEGKPSRAKFAALLSDVALWGEWELPKGGSDLPEVWHRAAELLPKFAAARAEAVASAAAGMAKAAGLVQ
jgi:hypothetical protein